MKQDNPFETRFRDYDAWFDRNRNVFESELRAIRAVLPAPGRWIEIGVGSGRFALALGIGVGVEPADGIASLAGERGVRVLKGFAEDLPLGDTCFDAAFMITTLCFARRMDRALFELHRILIPGGTGIIAFIPSDSAFGALYQSAETKDPFFRCASLRPRAEVIGAVEAAGLVVDRAVHTLTTDVSAANDRVEEPREGPEEGSFVVLRAIRPAVHDAGLSTEGQELGIVLDTDETGRVA